MAEIRTLKLNLLADVNDFSKGLETAQQKFKNFGDSLESMSRKAAVAFGVLAFAGKQTVDSASDLNEALSKNTVVFEDQAKAIEDFAKTADKNLGLSQRQALDAASGFAILGRMSNLTGQKLTNFSTDLTTLAADLASFNNTTTDEAIVALGAGLRGEAEPLRRYGILLSQTALEAKAAELGLWEFVEVNGKSKPIISEANKVIARQAIIMEQTALQQGDFARTADGAANKQRILAAEVENAKAQIGQGLLPAYQKLLDLIIPVTEWAGRNADAFVKIGSAVAIVAGSIVVLNYTVKTINMTFEAFNNIMKLATAAQAAFNFVMGMNPIGLVIIGVAALGAAFVAAYKNIEPFRDLIDSIWEKMKKLIDGIKNSAIAGAVTRAFNAVTGRASGGSVSAGTAYTVGEFGKEVFVPSTNGRIIPNDQLGGNVTINLNGIIDAESARRSIEKLLQDSARRTGAINLVGATL
jgi:hypothetical protein